MLLAVLYNTVLMIYVLGYILHRILSRINVDTGGSGALSPVLRAAEIFTFRVKARSDITISENADHHNIRLFL